MIPLIIDTDAGVDDAVAILLALASPTHRVEAITCVCGNVDVDRVMRNVPIVLDAGRAGDIPIFRGADCSLRGERHSARRIHGEDGLGDAGFSESLRRVQGEDAVAALVRMARDHPAGYDLVTLGPLTNIAMALQREPLFLTMFRRITVMGGAVRKTGNVTATAEFNIYADPEAAALVLKGARELTLLPWEVCLDYLVPFDEWDHLTDAGPLGRHFVRPMTVRRALDLRDRGFAGITLPDPLAMAAALDETLTVQQRARVEIDLDGKIGRGVTLLTDEGHAETPLNTRLVTSVEMRKFLEMLRRTFSQEM